MSAPAPAPIKFVSRSPVKVAAQNTLLSVQCVSMLKIRAAEYNVTGKQVDTALRLLAVGDGPKQQRMIWPYAVVEGLLCETV